MIALWPLALHQSKILENVYFDYDDYKLNAKSYVELNRLVHFLKANTTLCIELEGHTDSKGSEAYNQQLSTQRAKKIYDYLVQAGIDPKRLTYQGYGKTRPLVSNDVPENQPLNRRVAFKIMSL
jgi:OOP family OmpA-OmpF porin